MKRLKKIFSAPKTALIVYDCCGAPTMQESARRLQAIIDGGADIVELGIPFSDPMADGAAVQQASQQALANGAKLSSILDMAADLRQKNPETGLIVYGYYNVFLQFGVENLFQRLAAIGIDGIFIIDLPFEEYGEVEVFCHQFDIPLLRMIADNTPLQRAEKLLADAQGMVYCEGPAAVELVRKITQLPTADRSNSRVKSAAAAVIAEKVLAISSEQLENFVADCRKNI